MTENPAHAHRVRVADNPAAIIDLTHPEDQVGVVRDSAYARAVKPVLDRLLAVVALLLTLPFFLLAALVVLVSLGRPILLRQTRIGHHGQPFTVYKFRTMVPDRRRAQQRYDGPDRRASHKVEDDPRITRGGRILRRFSLDELPQLLNVLRGDMSMVGPRPELPSIVARHYSAEHHRRHLVKPGITGLWQVSERGSSVMFHRVDVDLAYVDEMSFATDVRILLRTLPAALMTQQGV